MTLATDERRSTEPTHPGTPETASRFEQDSYRWALEQIEALRAGRLADLDLANLARTLDRLVEQERAKLEAALAQILECLMKLDHPSQMRSRNWPLTIRQQRRRILRQMRRQPSLRAAVVDVLDRAYATARAAVTSEFDLFDDALPAVCPYMWDDAMGRDIEWA